jgi:hypothetical protein
MSETAAKPVRRDILAGIKPRATREPLDDEAILAVASKSGFAREDAPAASPPALIQPSSEGRDLAPPAKTPLRRERKKSPYNESFSAKVSLEAMNAIYEEANSREIQIGRVIDEMVAAWKAATGK